jgi:chitodextrinase
VSGTSGYEIEYSTQSNMRLPGKKAITGTSVTIKNLKAKTTYYVRVRAYKTVNGQKVYGSWSNVKQVKTK